MKQIIKSLTQQKDWEDAINYANKIVPRRITPSEYRNWCRAVFHWFDINQRRK